MTTLRVDPYQEIKHARKGDPEQKLYGGPIWYEDPDKVDEDVDIENLVLDVVHNTRILRDVAVEDVIIDGEVNRTMDGASEFTLTLHDPEREILNNPILQRAIDVKLDGLWFRLVGLEKQGSDLVLTFEDRLVSYLRSHKKVYRMSRKKMTRLEFCYMLIRKVKQYHIPVVIPELHKKQRIEKLSSADRRSLKNDVTHPGINRGQDITVKGKPATSKQIDIAENLLDVGEKMDVPHKFLVAIIMVAIQESEMGKYRYDLQGGQPDKGNLHQGVLHQDIQPGSVWRQLGGGGPTMSVRDVRGQAKAFYTQARNAYADDHGLSSEALAEKVQVAGTPDAWGQWKDEATNFVDAWGGRTGNPLQNEDAAGTSTRTFRKRYLFTTEEGNKVGGKPQNWWDAIKGLLQETSFAFFVSNGILYLISEGQLINGKVRMILSPDTPGVTDIDFNIDNGQDEATATVTCRAARWIAPPGTCVKLTGMGKANGRWLVAGIRRNVYARDAEITLKKADHTLPEPAPEVVTTQVGTSPGEGPPVKGFNDSVSAAYKAAKRISEKFYPYVWGGGHAKAGTPDHGTGGSDVGYDCSGSVAAVLVAGGWYDKGKSVPRSDQLPGAAGLVSGEGKYITVWANAQHTFIEFHKHGDQDTEDKVIHFGTGNWGGHNFKKGPCLQTRLHPHEGFKPYHPAGETDGPHNDPRRKKNKAQPRGSRLKPTRRSPGEGAPANP